MRDPVQVQKQSRGSIPSQASTAVAKQPGIWCMVGASELSSSVDLFCFALVRHKDENLVTSEMSSYTVCHMLVAA